MVNSGLPCSTSEKLEELLSLYDAWGGPQWISTTSGTGWESSSSPCSWQGVTCSSEGYVTELKLGDNNLQGSLSRGFQPAANLSVPCLFSTLENLQLYKNPSLSGAVSAWNSESAVIRLTVFHISIMRS